MVDDDWIQCKLADACSSIDYGLTASAADAPVGPRFLRITDIVGGAVNWHTVPFVGIDQETAVKYGLEEGDIVLARTGASTGASAYIKDPPLAVFASYLVRLKAKPEFDSRFLAYYLRSEPFWGFLRGVLGDKSAQPNASASTMTKAPLRAPRSKNEQRAIAHILGSLDDKIDLNRRTNETLEALARAIFKSWFVDFDPVRAKMEGRRPVGMDTETAALFPDRMQESEIGEIPAGWRVSEIGNEVRVVGGSTPSTTVLEYWEGGTIPWATPKDMSSLRSPVLLTTKRKITNRGVAQIGSGLLPSGTVLLSSRAPIGYLAIAEMPVAINQGFIAMVCDRHLFNHYVRLWTAANMEEVLARANGSTFLEISKSNFRPIPVLVPLQPIMGAFASLADPLHQRIACSERESATLAVLRDALLPKLLSGELRVPDAERMVEAAT